jgi:hypothetical protein
MLHVTEIVRAYGEPSKLLFYSVHLYDKARKGPALEGDYEFFPGSGEGDDTAYNIINVPIPPLWKGKGNGSTRSRSNHQV